jgi:hypothetical protein
MIENNWPADFLMTANRAAQIAISNLSSGSSLLSEQALKWLGTRCDLSEPGTYFTRAQSLPILAFPWWLEQSIHCSVDAEFQSDLMYSSINGYYFTRMLDDIMDGHDIERAVMPALYPLHMRFMSPYLKYFSSRNAFWDHFERILMITVDAVAGESTLKDLTEDDFVQFSARKPAAAVIPMAAVCSYYGRLDLLHPWENMFMSLGKWHQMSDDLRDWSSDYKSGNCTWLLAEAGRRRGDGESVPAWMGREGFEWVKAVIEKLMEDTMQAASALNSPGLVLYLQRRSELFSRQIHNMMATAAAYQELLQIDPFCIGS